MELGNRCKHGLYCACFMCGYENEITRLKEENEFLKKELAQSAPDPTEST